MTLSASVRSCSRCGSDIDLIADIRSPNAVTKGF
jgi:hypothetical protein